jgi:hypothetical protein
MRRTARLGAGMLAAVLVGGCATTSPRFELGSDCRLRSLPWTPGAPSPEFRVHPPTPEPRGSTSGNEGLTSDGGRDGGRGDDRRGAGFGFGLGGLLDRAQADFVPQWLADGPGFADGYSHSCMPIRCFARGGWPMVVDYTSDGASVTTIEIHVRGEAQPVVIELDNRRGRHLQQFTLPPALGNEARPAVLLLRSVRAGAGGYGAGNVQLHGLGAGPRAVGSVAIEAVEFGPPLVQRSARQQASYSFLSKSDFNHVSVSVLHVDNAGGQVRVDLAREFRFDGGISRGSVFGRNPPRQWDGTDAQNRASLGSHLLQVRAWMSAREEADWVTAWSTQPVRVAD